jgi:RNA polymerase sigma-70 factor (ECF subfamily)
MFRHLVSRYHAPLLRHLSGRLGDENEAAEAAQETMVRAYFALGKLRKAESFYSWLLAIADRVAKEMHRGRRRRATSLEVATPTDHAGAAGATGDRLSADVSRAVAELPDVLREVVLLRFYGGQSCAEISHSLGVPLGTVTSRLSRAYALLRKSLRGLLDDDQEVEADR